MNLSEEIMHNWCTSANEYAAKILSIYSMGYDGWTINEKHRFGVAIRYDSGQIISETFSGAYLQTGKMKMGDETINSLFLMSDNFEMAKPFSALCAEFIMPGEDGKFRSELIMNPTKWWITWKELLGNKTVDERVYDTLAELLTLKYLSLLGKFAEWNGPDGATYDIECDNEFYEVKSSLSRSKKVITLSNQFQLDPPDGTSLSVVFWRFERAQSGVSINDVVKELVRRDYSVNFLNMQLKKLGLEEGKSARDRKYIVHDVTKYQVDETFPAIRPSSFVGGMLPENILNITYSVSLDGISGEKLDVQEGTNGDEVQNN